MRSSTSLSIKRFTSHASGLIDKAVAGDAPGRIRYSGTVWFARPYPSHSNLTFAKGERVLIIARQGTTLLVQPKAAISNQIDIWP